MGVYPSFPQEVAVEGDITDLHVSTTDTVPDSEIQAKMRQIVTPKQMLRFLASYSFAALQHAVCLNR